MDIRKIAYELYKIDWVHGHISLEEQLRAYREYVIDKELYYDESYLFDDFLFDNGYDNELYVCEDEFFESEYLDEEYIESLIPHNSVLWNAYQKDMRCVL